MIRFVVLGAPMRIWIFFLVLELKIKDVMSLELVHPVTSISDPAKTTTGKLTLSSDLIIPAPIYAPLIFIKAFFKRLSCIGIICICLEFDWVDNVLFCV
ncbi:hypothetical protein Hanom_Chr03g00249471 [Helianthus anomalus]